MSDGENFLSDGEAIEAREKSQSRKECFVKIENLAMSDGENFDGENFDGENLAMSDGENFLSDGEAIEAREKSQSRKECFVKIENLAYPDHDHSYRKAKILNKTLV